MAGRCPCQALRPARTWREWQLATGFWDLLTREERRALAALGQDAQYPPRTVLCAEGDAATEVFILLDGIGGPGPRHGLCHG
jgi:hypothetical protein